MTEPATMSCDDALRLLAAYLDGELDGPHRHDLDDHLARCRSCFSRAEFERGLKTQLSALRAQPVKSSFEERIRELIDRFSS